MRVVSPGSNSITAAPVSEPRFPGDAWLCEDAPRGNVEDMARSFGLGLTLSLAGCHPANPEPDEQSTYVDLYLEDEIEVCAGQLAEYDRFIEQVFESWTGGGPADFRVAVHVRNRDCSDNVFSCAKESDVWLGYYQGQYHELTHAITKSTDGASVELLQEGTAEAFGPGLPDVAEPSRLVDILPERLFSSMPGGLEYDTGGKFVRFLLDGHGSESVRAYYRAMSDVEAPSQLEFADAFESIFDEALDDAWADFVSERRCAFDYWYCNDERLVELPYEMDGLDCDDPDAQSFVVLETAPEIRFAPVRIVEIASATPASVVVTYGGVSIHTGRCGDCWEQSASEMRINDTPGLAEWPLDLAPGRNVFIIQSLIGRSPTFSIRESE